MNNKKKEKLDQIIDYYKQDGLAIIGLNDSQGVDTTSFVKKGLLEFLADSLTSKELSPIVIDAFSLLINKTEHIDYILDSNLSVEEIKKSQVYSAVEAFTKAMEDMNLPEQLGKIGYIYKGIYRPKQGDEKILISDTLFESKEPLVIYSSGTNNLMREVANNPFNIIKDYKQRNIKPNYYYTLGKAEDPATLKTVIDGIERNFDHILSINGKADIYSLGAYAPKSLQKDSMTVFRELIDRYNAALEGLCNNYHVTYVNTNFIGQEFNNSTINFHVSRSGHHALANFILNSIYEKKIVNPVSNDDANPSKRKVYAAAHSRQMEELIVKDMMASLKRQRPLSGYSLEVERNISREHFKEAKVFGKIRKEMQ